MKTIMDYKEKYENALEWMREIYPTMEGFVKEDAEHCFPELKESEDERIRKWLIDYFDNVNDEVVKENRLKIIAYLEKQKDEAKRQYDLGVQAGREEALYGIEKQKEQKLIDPSDDELQRHQDELHNFMVFATKQAKEHHISFAFAHDFEWHNFCAELLSYFAEQKPAEWSEEDENGLGDLVWCIEIARSIAKDEQDMGTVWNAENWLNNRVKSLRPKPQVDLDAIAKREYERGKNDGYQEGFTDAESVYNNRVIYHIDNPNIQTLDPNVVIQSATDGTDNSMPHWKPSEEQMCALKKGIGYLAEYGTSDDDLVLDTLYDDLKKL